MWVRTAIIALGIRSGQAAPGLIDGLKHADWRVASSSAVVLGALQSAGKLGVYVPALSALKEAEEAPHPAVREAAAGALALFPK